MTDAAKSIDAERRRRQTMNLLLLGAGLVAAVLLYLWLTARNEPTIIIRGGSIVFELVDAEWVEADEDPEEGGGPPHWTHSGAPSTSQRYRPSLVAQETGGEVCGPLPEEAAQVSIHSSGAGRHVKLNFRKDKTHAIPQNANSLLERDSGNRSILRMQGTTDQVVRRIQLHQGAGKPWDCTFEENEFESLTLAAK